MSIIAEFVIPAEAVPGGSTLTALPTATIILERILPSEEAVHPIFWVTGVESDQFLEAVREEPGIADVQELVELESATLYRATWRADTPIIEGIKTLRATIFNAEGSAGEWVFQVIADERQRLQSFQQIFADQGIPVELRRISSFTEEGADGHDLTRKQRETLVVAYQMGYFDEPRTATQEAIAEHIGISGRAVSKRLHGGMKNLIYSTLINPSGQSGPPPNG